MGNRIEQIGIGKTSLESRAISSRIRFGPSPLITIPASGFWKRRTQRPDRRPHSITRTPIKKILASTAATTEDSEELGIPIYVANGH